MLRDHDLRVFWLSRINYENNTGVKDHYHNDLYQLIFILDGEGTIEINSEIYDVLPKHAYFISKKFNHSFRFKSPTSTIDVKFDIINEKLESLFITNPIPIPFYIGESPKLKELFKLSVLNMKQPNPLIPYRIDGIFKDLLLMILQENTFSKDSEERSLYSIIKNEYHPDFPVMEYLSEHLHTKLTLEDIAQHFNFHPHYIIDLFKKKFDTTPMNFLQVIRVEKSKEYLELSNYTVTEIAELVGLSAPYFSRLFRSKEGVSPTEYREQSRTVIGKHILLEEEFSPSLKNQPKISVDL